MQMFLFICFASIGIYCILAIALRLPSLRIHFGSTHSKKRRESILDLLAKKIAPKMPLGSLKETELNRKLSAAGMDLSPREYISRTLVHTAIWIIVALLLLPFSKIAALLFAGIACIIFFIKKNEIRKKGTSRMRAIEHEIPAFVSYVTGRIRGDDHNILDIIDTYKSNYDNDLTKELSITAADMRTGNQEVAIQRLLGRVNSPLMIDLGRGILSAMRGDDVYDYFQTLNRKLSNLWAQRLRTEALQKEPKVSRMSYILFGIALVTIFAVLILFLIYTLSTFMTGVS